MIFQVVKRGSGGSTDSDSLREGSPIPNIARPSDPKMGKYRPFTTGNCEVFHMVNYL